MAGMEETPGMRVGYELGAQVAAEVEHASLALTAAWSAAAELSGAILPIKPTIIAGRFAMEAAQQAAMATQAATAREQVSRGRQQRARHIEEDQGIRHFATWPRRRGRWNGGRPNFI